MIHLDLEAAKTAQAIMKDVNPTKEAAKTAEDLITRTLGVVQENGPYAAIVFLCSKISDEKDTPFVVRRNLLELAEALGAGTLTKSGDVRKVLDSVIKAICADMHVLLLVKQAWEQTLIYARHSAKSMKAQASAGT
jgi:hypothetical protein